MAASVVIPADRSPANRVDDAITKARGAHDAGVGQVWVAQQLDGDAIALAAVIGAAVPGLGVGTSVVPINPRHPLLIASAAHTAQAAANGNFSLGLGLGGHAIEQQAFGITPTNSVQRLREHLTVLRAINDERTVDFHGTQITAVDSPVMPVAPPGTTAFPVYVAAMGPRALRVTGELADGTLPLLAGPRTIEEFIVPTITGAAADAGRPDPRIIAIVPVAVTDDAAAVHAAVADRLAFYDQIPSYQKVLAREGVSGAAELALVGTAPSLTRRLKTYLDAGATDVALMPLQTEWAELAPVWDLAAAF
ncbi:TIGR03564 family F420-dependent LLM class oxidoreductase [Mycolicibacillus parakoreensis]|uniref:TIGR03564 family F420-dependent LLM class oxidoreductase n=1 Tax=Mycolicibacillus parakoreensis TaxID=1069221 RepID=A0ABY3U6E7_9MYCO|nr:TIGR03564 family F420-dependent LLM class oxidoreductase [Mycolicibacillus parakoreensis]MCV7314593.1 TIGR03564 family F420-dependent LLM class oxidoreductase [Mycolicibacillus parakoreensis]ULN53082.1 TIGR03564 family F420-dependent LLM class oxidoreductase [Mycolicibacillus parakoreensis]